MSRNTYGPGVGWADFLDRTRSAKVDVGDTQLAYVEVGGPGDGPPLVLLHGIGNTWRFWTGHLVNPPTSSSRIVAFDLPGFGDSSTSDEAVTATLTGHLIASACDILSIDRAVFVGHSMGALGALSIAADHPDLTLGVVAIAPALQDLLQFHARPVTALGHPILAAKYAGLLVAALLPLPRRVAELVAASTGLRRAALAAFVRYPDLLPADAVLACAVGTGAPGVVQILATAGKFDLPSVLDRVSASMLVINGTHDGLSTPDAVQRLFGRRHDTSVVMLEDTGHWPMVERPTAVNKAIDGWLAALQLG